LSGPGSSQDGRGQRSGANGPRNRHARRYLPIHPTDIERNPIVRLRIALGLGLALLTLGSSGYILIEHFHPLDAVYLTVITLGTVGFDTIKPLDPPGKVFTILLILCGLGTAAWVFASIVDVLVGEETQRYFARIRMQHSVDGVRNHCIVCGYGRIGQQIAETYTREGVSFVVIEQAEARLELLREQGLLHIDGDAADDESLIHAGIDRARALIAVTPTDAINTFIVLSARELQPDLYIVARADTIQNEAKLRRAGASKVVSPHILGGRWMGITAINPAVTDFLNAMTTGDRRQFALRELELDSRCSVVGKSFGDASLKGQTGALIVAVRRGGAAINYIPNPPDDLVLTDGDMLIAIGSPEQLDRLGKLLAPS